METPASNTEDDQFLAAETHQLLHDEVVAEAMGHFMRWQAEGGERRLAAYIRRLSDYRLSRDEVDELVRETISRVLGAVVRGRYIKRENVDLSAFVHIVARNLYINEGRRRRNQHLSLEQLSESGQEPADSLDALEAQIEATDMRHLLARGLAALTTQERYVITAHIVDKRPFADIAKEVGKSPAAVRKAASRAVAKLRALLGGPK